MNKQIKNTPTKDEQSNTQRLSFTQFTLALYNSLAKQVAEDSRDYAAVLVE